MTPYERRLLFFFKTVFAAYFLPEDINLASESLENTNRFTNDIKTIKATRQIFVLFFVALLIIFKVVMLLLLLLLLFVRRW